MTWVVTVVIGLAMLAYVALALLAWRRPLLARLAFREATRRPGQSALVVAGLMVGSAAIFCMQFLADTELASATATATQAWGRVDLTVSDGHRPFDAGLARALAADANLRQSVAGVQGGVELDGSAADLDRETGNSSVRLIGFDPAAQAAFGTFTLADGRRTDGADLTPGEVLLSRSLATVLGAQVGDRLEVSARSARAASLKVAGIALPEDSGAYGLRPAVFAPLSAFAPLMKPGTINIIRISTHGEGQAEIAASHEAAPIVRAALALLPGGRSLVVRESKAAEIEAGTVVAADMRGWETAYSLLVALVGIALVVNLVLALAEERRPRFAVLRALGLTRSGLVVVSLIEGALYSLTASVLGVLPGTVGAMVIVGQFPNWGYTTLGRDILPVDLSVEPISVLLAVALSSLIALVTVLVASVRTSQMTISAAIKDLPSPQIPTARPWWATVFVAAVGVAGLAGVIVGAPGVQMLGGVGLIVVVATLVRGRLSDRSRGTLAGAALSGWPLILATIHPPETQEASGAWVLIILVVVFGLSVLVAANVRLLESVFEVLARRRGGILAILRPPLAYFGRRPMRAGMGMGAFALVVATLSTVASFRGTYDHQMGSDASAYDIRVVSLTKPALQLPASVVVEVARQTAVITYGYRADVRSIGSDGLRTEYNDQLIHLYEFSDSQFAAPPVRLLNWDPRFRNEADVWSALRDDPTLLASSVYPSGGTVTLDAPSGRVDRRIVALFSPVPLVGLVGSSAAMAPFATRGPGTTLLIALRPGLDIHSTSQDLQRALYATGADATSMADLVADASRGLSFLNIVYVLMGMGLFIGIASLGVLALRAVIERRRTIGVLRALGYQPRAVVVGMLAEALITATSGLLIGAGAGFVAGFVSVRAAVGDALANSFGIDTTAIAGMVTFVYVAVVLMTIGPALRASQLRPAQALALVD